MTSASTGGPEPTWLPEYLRVAFTLLISSANVHLHMVDQVTAAAFILTKAMLNPMAAIRSRSRLPFVQVLSSLRIAGGADEGTCRDFVSTAITQGWLARPEGDERTGPHGDVEVLMDTDLQLLVAAVRRFREGKPVFIGQDTVPHSPLMIVEPSDEVLEALEAYQSAADLYIGDCKQAMRGLSVVDAVELLYALIRELRPTLGGVPTRGWLASADLSADLAGPAPHMVWLAEKILAAGDLIARAVLNYLESIYEALARQLTQPPDESNKR